MENWKDVVGYEGLYRVSDKGRIWSCKRRICLSQQTTPDGYKLVILYNRVSRKGYGVHRLVAKAFIEGGSDGLQVNHKDGVKENNCADNLEWCTPAENIRHAVRKGLFRIRRGSCHHRSIYKEEDIGRAYRMLKEGFPEKTVTKETGIPRTTLTAVKSKRMWNSVTDKIDLEETNRKLN